MERYCQLRQIRLFIESVGTSQTEFKKKLKLEVSERELTFQ